MDNNKLIAEFMQLPEGFVYEQDIHGYTQTVDGYHIGEFKEPYTAHGLKYHTSWDWLMPVVEKIESLKYTVRIDSDKDSISVITHACYIWDDPDLEYVAASRLVENKLSAVYETILEFIAYYNAKLKGE